MLDKEVGKRIRKQRELLGYTRETLAEKLNVSPKFCADIELGTKGMSVETLCKLTEVLMVSADYILFGRTGTEADEEIFQLANLCSNEHKPYLKTMMRAFLQACEEKDL